MIVVGLGIRLETSTSEPWIRYCSDPEEILIDDPFFLRMEF